jgi:hypothetical protein
MAETALKQARSGRIRPWTPHIEKQIKRNVMPQSSHTRLAELHNLAAHNHSAAAVAHGKGDHRTGHELSKQALEHTLNAHKLSEELATKVAESAKA